MQTAGSCVPGCPRASCSATTSAPATPKLGIKLHRDVLGPRRCTARARARTPSASARADGGRSDVQLQVIRNRISLIPFKRRVRRGQSLRTCMHLCTRPACRCTPTRLSPRARVLFTHHGFYRLQLLNAPQTLVPDPGAADGTRVMITVHRPSCVMARARRSTTNEINMRHAQWKTALLRTGGQACPRRGARCRPHDGRAPCARPDGLCARKTAECASPQPVAAAHAERALWGG